LLRDLVDRGVAGCAPAAFLRAAGFAGGAAAAAL
jgi:hypothetical protein